MTTDRWLQEAWQTSSNKPVAYAQDSLVTTSLRFQLPCNGSLVEERQWPQRNVRTQPFRTPPGKASNNRPFVLVCLSGGECRRAR